MSTKNNYATEYEQAVENGPESFETYMTSIFSNDKTDWEEWDNATGDGYGKHDR